MGYGLLSLLADWDGVWDMGYGLPVLLVYRDGIWDMGYSYIGMGMGYRVWGMDCMYCRYIGMEYGL